MSTLRIRMVNYNVYLEFKKKLIKISIGWDYKYSNDYMVEFYIFLSNQ